MDSSLETKSLEAWLRTAVSEHGFSASEVDHLRSVASMFRNPHQLLHFDKRFFHYILASDHSNHMSTDSVHIKLLEHGRPPANFTLELQSLSGFDIKFHAISNDTLLAQIFTEDWMKGQQVQTVLFNLRDESTSDVDLNKEIARCYGTSDDKFIFLDPVWSSVVTLFNVKTTTKKLCQVCSMKQWPASIVPDPRPGFSHLCLIIISEEAEMWKYGAEGDIVQYNLDDHTTAALQPVHDPRFSSQLLKYTNDGHRFVAYRKNNPEVLVYDSHSLTCLLNVPLDDMCPILDLPFQLPYMVGALISTDLLQTIQAAVLAKRCDALSGMVMRPGSCYFIVPAVSRHFLALAFFSMGWEATTVRLYGPLAKPLDDATIKMLS